MYKTYELWPETQLGSPTLSWVQESIITTRDIRFNSNQIDKPTLILQAGLDSIVDNQGQDVYCARALVCTIEYYPTSKHGMLYEHEGIRSRVIESIDTFFTNN